MNAALLRPWTLFVCLLSLGAACQGSYAPAIRLDGAMTRTTTQRTADTRSRATQAWRGAVVARAVWSPTHRPLEVVDPPRVRRYAHVPRRVPCRDARLCAWERAQVRAALGTLGTER